MKGRSAEAQEERTMTIGYDKPLYVLPFDHRATFSKNMFGWTGQLTAEQTAEIAAVKQVIYDAFQDAVADGPGHSQVAGHRVRDGRLEDRRHRTE
jgi:hypothetical protein